MKKMFAAFIVLFAINASAADLHKKVFVGAEEVTLQKAILDTYAEALKISGPLKYAYLDLLSEVGPDGSLSSISSPTDKDLFFLSSGKGGASSYGGMYLLGVPETRNGTGLIEDYGMLIRVRYNIDLSEDVLVITLESFVDIKNSKTAVSPE